MCKRHTMITELVELKRQAEDAKKAYDEMCKKIISNMNSSGIKTDEVEHVAKVTVSTTTKVDTEACKEIKEWVTLKEEEATLAKQRKEIEKDHRCEGATSLRVTLKA